MRNLRINRGTIKLENLPRVVSYASVAGKKESEGPLGKSFDIVSKDSLFDEKSFERAEAKMQQLSLACALNKAKLNYDDIDMIFAGDLLNQCISSSFGIRKTEIPFVGLYGACSTMALSLCLAALAVDSGAAEMTAAVTSSHFCSAERQYRFPLDYGCQRPQTAQWTVTGSGAVILGKNGRAAVDKICFGQVTDLGIKDANNMGAAMAPAAACVIERFLNDTKTKPTDYDAIFTGDLGFTGTKLLYAVLEKDGIDIKNVHNDCGMMIFDREKQDVHSGGSGCGCSASVLTSYILKKVESGEYKNILFCATGALLSPTSTMQGESIPCIAHIVNFVNLQ
ncbi:MAG: stage V sporulation protein AD [Clostridiales bacterium]|nr:stage V sporulation protein AD [Candidatus Equinaster intestinalis]